MIISVKAVTDTGEVILYPSTAWLLTNIDGIDPGDAELFHTEKGATDGAMYNGSRRPSRQITLSLDLMGDIETNRHDLYSYFRRTKEITLYMTTAERSWHCSGRIKKIGVPIFEKKESVEIELTCKDPNLYAEGGSVNSFQNIKALFELPFSITSEGQELSSIDMNTERVINYNGDVDVGFLIKLHALGTVTGFRIVNSDTFGKIEIDDSKLKTIVGTEGLIAGDDMEISTVVGDKHVILTRNGEKYNCLNAINKSPEWFMLSTGGNKYVYECTMGGSLLQVGIEYQTAYDGV